MLKLAEVEKMLSISRTTLKRWIYAKKIRATKVGRDWRISENEVETIRAGLRRA
jgi:excisionase family DNA binding protein